MLYWDQLWAWSSRAKFSSVAIAVLFGSSPLYAGPGTAERGTAEQATSSTLDISGTPAVVHSEKISTIRAIIEREVANTKLPADVAEAVVYVESGYNSNVIGSVGEIGLMQVRPETAAMLGFRGTTTELANPAVNIHYGVIYLSRAWRLADGDLCRALMKYRAGHGEETMTPRSKVYCNRARNRLLAMNSAFASPGAVTAIAPVNAPADVTRKMEPKSKALPIRPKDIYASYRQGTPAASRAYWAAHEARIRNIKARLESKWKHVASR
ncbi:lytic transglycosylase domain-containing protein [Bradyrhizobium sp. JYMT SZCCT0428]|uniref:lytic transglycosylase domain-containing protein n=1 Tax=Bradyrhizobium sp. JYMT SZCCT0428 TaxID=2807673 RepID=UPI001BAD19D3|nr:transglycosylase SLT domain-containing protein [Bradyrhizobium sp. JYMT SZCCT0428]MBR1156891.1 transglycosylase SLT domain-containing protein [Bradyrhizobium sp. JYMT SZCCT0428]